MKRCKHKLDYRVYRAIFRIGTDVATTMRTWSADGERIATCEVNRCTRCGAWLPLGPSDEHASEAVEIEIRAAEIAAAGEPVWTEQASGPEVREGCGWNAHACGFADTWCSGNRDALAGYLAREIATHGDDR